MKPETLSETLARRLDESAGMHARIAKEAGISQASISRYYRRKCSPTLANAEALMRWFDAYDRRNQKSALRVSDAKRVRVKSAGPAAAAPVAQ